MSGGESAKVARRGTGTGELSRKERRGAFLRSFRFRMMFLASLSLLVVTTIFGAAVFVFFTWMELENLDRAQENTLHLLVEQLEDAGQFYLDSPDHEELRRAWQRRNAEFQVFRSDWSFCENILSEGNGTPALDPDLAREVSGKGDKKPFTLDPAAMKAIPDSAWMSPCFPKPDRVLLRAGWVFFRLEGQGYYLFALQPLDGLLASRRTLLNMILFMLGFAALLSTAAGYFTARSATRPFARINRAISKVSIENMRLDVSVQDTDEEIREMVLLIDRMLENLGKSIRQLQQFTADASHELRTPLAVMKGITEVALLKDREREYYAGKLQELATHIEGMQALVGALLELARLDTFSRLDSRDQVELLIIADEALGMAEGRIRQKRQTLERALSPAPTLGRETLLLRLVTNLLDNAVKYTAEGGTIRIRTFSERERGRAVLEIEDTGKGMTEEEISHCFDRFWRADHSRTTAGYGLGLPLVLRIAELHDGKPEIRSQPGRGTLFRIGFPLDGKALEDYDEP